MLNNLMHITLLEQCNRRPRNRPLKINGTYDRDVIEDAFKSFGSIEWTCANSYTIDKVTVREQSTLSTAVAFEVRTFFVDSMATGVSFTSIKY